MVANAKTKPIEKKVTLKLGAVYGRQSYDQDEESEHGSTEQQVHLGLEMAKMLSMTSQVEHKVVYQLVEKPGVSGGNTNRPKYQELLSLIESGKIDFVIAKEVSRLNRSTSDFCAFIQTCAKHNVSLHVRGLNFDPSDMFGTAMLQMLAVIAELERKLIKERTRSSIRSAMKHNAKIHGGPLPLGLDRDPNRRGFPIPNKTELGLVEQLMKRFNDTGSIKETIKFAKKHSIKNKKGTDFNNGSMQRLLSNEKYIGKLSVTGEEDLKVDLPTGVLISPDLFTKVQQNLEKIAENPSNIRRRKRVYLLSGLLEFEDGTSFCGKSGIGRLGDTHFYYCNDTNKISVDALALEESVFAFLRRYENDEEMIAIANDLKSTTYSKLDFVDQQIGQTGRALKATDRQEKELMDKLNTVTGPKTGRVGEWLDKQLQAIDQERKELTSTLDVLQRDRNHLASSCADANALQKSLKVVYDRLEKAEPEVQRGILRQLFKKIKIFNDNRVELRWGLPVCSAGRTQVAQGNEWGG